MATTTSTIKYNLAEGSDVREKAAFNFEFPQKMFVVLE